MSKLCERPGCSEPGAAVYGMVAEDLLFWIVATDTETPSDAKLLCRRHADAMVVPLGWTLDDRRQPTPSLFQTRRYDTKASLQATVQAAALAASPPSVRRHIRRIAGQAVEQLQIDGTGPTVRPSPELIAALDETTVEMVPTAPHQLGPDAGNEIGVLNDQPHHAEAADLDETTFVEEAHDAPAGPPVDDDTNFGAWRPEFDIDDDLDGLLETKSPLLARAFRGTARQR